MKIRFTVVIALVLVIGGLFSLAPQNGYAAVPEGVSRYVPKDRAANRARIAAGVEKAIETMNFFIRPFARLKLDVDRFDIGVVEFRVGKGTVSIRHDDHLTTSPSSGKRIQKQEDGDLIWLSQKVEADRVVQVFDMDDGKLTLTYSFSDDAKAVTIHAVLISPKLPAPLKYHMVFDRAL